MTGPMEKPEIQELLEGMLNDEQTAEVLHRMSVSPEKLTEFRQHITTLDIKDIAIAAVFVFYIFPRRDHAFVFQYAGSFGYKFLGE